MSEFQDDLNNCDQEPIHIPGQIQSHGFLIVVDTKYNISHCSDNITRLFPELGINILGQPLQFLEQLIGDNYPPVFIADLLSLGKDNQSFEQVNPYKLVVADNAYYLILSTAPGYYLLEFEPAVPHVDSNIQRLMGHSISKMLASTNLSSLLHNTALQVKNTIHYDRVMIYRFA